MEELELFPGVSEFETEKLAAMGYTPDDVQRLVGFTLNDTVVEIQAARAIDEASVVIEAELLLGDD